MNLRHWLAAAVLLAFAPAAQAQISALRVLPVAADAVTLAPARCDSGLHNAQIDISTILHPGAGQLTGGAPLVDILVDGRSVGAQPATSRLLNPINRQGGAVVDVHRTLTLPGPGGTHTLQFVLNRASRSAPQSMTFSCLQAQLPHAVTTYWQPDIGIDTSMIGAFYLPPTPPPECHPQGLIQCPIYTAPDDYRFGELPAGTIFINDPTHLSTIDLSRIVGCPATGDAIKTVNFVVPISSDRFDYGGSRLALTHETAWWYSGQELTQHETQASYVDARVTRQEPRSGRIGYPLGHEWLSFQRQLPCTSDGIFTLTLDPDNQLHEANENNNTLRLHYRTR